MSPFLRKIDDQLPFLIRTALLNTCVVFFVGHVEAGPVPMGIESYDPQHPPMTHFPGASDAFNY